MIGLDSNVVLRYLVQDDPEQTARAAAILETRLSSANPGFLSTVALAETVWVLDRSYGFSKDEILTAVDKLLQADRLSIEHEAEVHEALEILRDRGGDFADALIAEIARSAGCTTTITFDRRALRLPGFEAA